MNRFSQLLAEGMKSRGHKTEVLFPRPFFSSLPLPQSLKKWFGYLDQFIVFPLQAKKKINSYSADTLFVFTDHALGPWVPLVTSKPHIIHCHDFLAQQSALYKIAINKTSRSGRIYQKMIHSGYSKGKNFISVSKKTQEDLLSALSFKPDYCEVIYNSLSPVFKPLNTNESKRILTQKINIDLTLGYILHVGGNVWYKNRAGVFQLYEAWRSISNTQLPLVFVGEKPSPVLSKMISQSSYKKDIHFIQDVSDELLNIIYAGATVLLFPSLAEGFGWPIAEAMAAGCLVITTDQPPMTEVAKDAGFYISRKPDNKTETVEWAMRSAQIIENVTTLPEESRKCLVQSGIENAKRFSSDTILQKIEAAYQNIIDKETRN
ncbi:MAG: glycosyltransferase [Ilyomonas sp.]